MLAKIYPPHSGGVFAVFRTKTILNEQAAQERTERGYGYEDEKPPVPPAVENVTGNDDEEVLQEQLVLAAAECVVEHKPIEQENYRKENGKLDGVEEHTWGCAPRVAHCGTAAPNSPDTYKKRGTLLCLFSALRYRQEPSK